MQGFFLLILSMFFLQLDGLEVPKQFKPDHDFLLKDNALILDQKKSDLPLCVSNEKMAVYILMMTEKYMRAFISHPKTYAYFLDQMARYDVYLISLKEDMIALLHQFPEDKDVLKVVDTYVWLLETISDPSFSKELFLLVTWGVADTSGITHLDVRAALGDLQVKLFKNFLQRQGIGCKRYPEAGLVKKFKKKCSNLKLYPTLNLFVDQIKKKGALLSDVYSGDEEDEVLSVEQSHQLDHIFEPFVKKPPIPKKLDKPDDMNPGLIALEQLFKNYPAGLLVRNEIIQLFFQVLKEIHPINAPFFSNIQNKVEEFSLAN